MIIPSIKIAYRQYKELKDYQNIRMNPHVGSQPPRRVPEISQKQFKGNEILKPIKSSELQKSIESFSEN